MRVTVNGVRLYFDVEGSGLVALDTQMIARPTLVLLHGGPGADHSFFKPEFSAMAGAAQVIYLDLRGSGRSEHGDPAMWTWEQWADDVAGFCRALDIETPVLVGTSSGGRVAVTCAVRRPDLPGGLVLDSTLFGPGSLEDSLEVFERRGGAVAREAAARFIGGDTSPEATADDIDTVGCAVLILSGEDDPASPAATARRVASAARHPALDLHVFADVRHGVFRQAPAPAFALVRSFLTESHRRPAD